MDNTMDFVAIKVGSGVITNETGGIKEDVIDALSDQCRGLIARNFLPIIISSGAINAGRDIADIHEPNLNTATEQYLSSVGQPRLFGTYAQSFSKHGITTGQVLLTPLDLQRDQERDNFINLLEIYLRRQEIPIINENDTTSTVELRTDNDGLATTVAIVAGAKWIVNLTENVNGLLDSNGIVIPTIFPDDQEEKNKKFVRFDKSIMGRGGMPSKFAAMCAAANAGIHAYMMGSRDLHMLSEINPKDDTTSYGTHFVAKK